MSGTWSSLAQQPGFSTGTMILLTDGRIMAQENGTKFWHALTPDSSGSYVNGTWSTLASMANSRLYYASGVLMDGRVIVCGGEYSDAGADTNTCEIYDPFHDAWSPIPAPSGWGNIGDAACCVLPDGRFMIGDIFSTRCAIYDPVTGTWADAGNLAVTSSESTWILLPDNTIVAPQCWSPYQAEKYVIATNTWHQEGTPPVPLIDQLMHETGPAMLTYNGKVVFFGAANSAGHGKTAVYTPPALPSGVGTWAAGPDIPPVGDVVMVSNDCPAALLPNGKVLFTAASFQNNYWGQPIHFFEYDPVTYTISQVPIPPNNNALLYASRMLLLPTGQVLFSPSTSQVACYTPDGGPLDAWRPTIWSISGSIDVFNEYLLIGTQLNGLSQANIYGDDCTPATNYPLVQLTDQSTGDVRYCATYAFSTMGVATGASLQSVRFSTTGVPDGTFDLVVIANGIRSAIHHFSVHRPKVLFMENLRVKREFEHLGKEVYEGDPLRDDWAVDPAVDRLIQEVGNLRNSVVRLNSLIEAKDLPEVGRKIAKQASADGAVAAGGVSAINPSERAVVGRAVVEAIPVAVEDPQLTTPIADRG